jgi:type IV secretory pathway TrbL component
MSVDTTSPPDSSRSCRLYTARASTASAAPVEADERVNAKSESSGAAEGVRAVARCAARAEPGPAGKAVREEGGVCGLAGGRGGGQQGRGGTGAVLTRRRPAATARCAHKRHAPARLYRPLQLNHDRRAA